LSLFNYPLGREVVVAVMTFFPNKQAKQHNFIDLRKRNSILDQFNFDRSTNKECSRWSPAYSCPSQTICSWSWSKRL